MAIYTECLIIGAGASGLFCAAELAKRGKQVVVLDKGKRMGRKILISGGGFCNFTHLDVQAHHYLCHNPHFVKSALAQFTPWDFLDRISKYGITWHEKEAGQLFCDHSSKDIVQFLQRECEKHKVAFYFEQDVADVVVDREKALPFSVQVGDKIFYTQALIVATGGLSMPKLGVSPLGFQLAQQFGIPCYPPRAGLVPFTYREEDKCYSHIAGVALPVSVTSQSGQVFEKEMLFTHRGLSGPAILQISNYWHTNESIEINLLPTHRIHDVLRTARQASPKLQLKTLLNQYLPQRLVTLFFEKNALENPLLADLNKKQMDKLHQLIHHWQFTPNGTEGYRTAEVTLGGVNTDYISSKTMEAKNQKGLYFIGEVLDVTGWLGGYNFQWAWSSAYACAVNL